MWRITVGNRLFADGERAIRYGGLLLQRADITTVCLPCAPVATRAFVINYLIN